jgi:hypothetical protein
MLSADPTPTAEPLTFEAGERHPQAWQPWRITRVVPLDRRYPDGIIPAIPPTPYDDDGELVVHTGPIFLGRRA